MTLDEQNNIPAYGAGKHEAVTPPRSTGRKIGIAAVILLAAALVAGAAYAVYGTFFSGDIFPGVQMGDADLSRLDRAQARQALEQAYGSAQIDHTVDVQVGDQSFSISAQEAGLAFDVSASVERAYQYGRQGNVLTRMGQFLAGWIWKARLEPATSLDSSMLKSRIAEIASASEQSLVPSSFLYENGKLTLDKGQSGRALDQDALLAQLENHLAASDFSPVQGTLTETQPQPLDAAHILKSVNSEVTQTTLDLESDPTGETIRPGTPGVKVDENALAAALLSDNRMETVPCQVTQPEYSVSEYKALLFRDVLGECTTDFNPGNVGRTTNVLLATDFCNGVILMPGEVFSYNDTVGPRTYARGFQDATIYVGDSAEDGVGGGICQVSSTIYSAALRADLKIVERTCHSRYVNYVPLGEDATVAWGSRDFRFENNTGYPIKILTSHKRSNLTVKLYGTKTQNKTVEIETKRLSYTPFGVQYEVDTSLPLGTEKVKTGGYPGYQTESYRVVYIDGVEVSRTLENKSTYRKYDKVILHNPLPTSGQQPVTQPDQPSQQPGQPSVPPATSDTQDPNVIDPNLPQEEVPATPGELIYLPVGPNGGLQP